MELGQFAAAIGQPFLRFFDLAPSGELCIIEIDRLRQLRQCNREVIEDFLSFEVGPLRQDYFIFKRKREDASEEIPLSISDLIGDTFDEEQGEG